MNIQDFKNKGSFLIYYYRIFFIGICKIIKINFFYSNLFLINKYQK
jgi:hypothetical protein